MKKSILRIPLLTLSILISPLVISTNVFAAPEVIIASEAKDIPNDIVQQIVEENPNTDVINILEYGDLSESNETTNTNLPELDKKVLNDLPSNRMATAVYTTPITTKKIINKKQVAKDEFKFSVSKGESVTISRDYKGSITGSIAGVFRGTNLGANITLSAIYKKGTKYSGPPENSIYNSREFRMKFFQETGSYTQTYYKQLWLSGKLISSNKIINNGTYKKPTSYASYNLDSYITNTTY